MTGGSLIRAIGPQAAQDAPNNRADGEAGEPLALESEWAETWAEDEPSTTARGGWIVPALALLAIAGWSGFYVWALQADILTGGTPVQWVGWIINWSVPVLLVISLWILAMRMSRREAGRFADAAALLSREASELENRLVIVNRELSLAREFLGAQSLELESLGRVASERLSTHATEIKGLILANGQQIDSIATVSDTALSNMQKLRDDLPVIANSARDVSNQVGNAGRTAHEQLDKLIAGFQRLNEFGQASTRQVDALSGKVKETLDTFAAQVEQLDAQADQRFGALMAKSEEFRADLDSREVDALAAMRRRADELRQGIAGLRETIEAEEARSGEALRQRMAVLQGESDAVATALQEAEGAALASLEEAKDRLHREIAQVVADLDRLDEQALSASQQRIRALNAEATRFDELLAVRDVRFNDAMARRQDEFDTRESQASEILAQRLAALDEALSERRDAQIAETARLVSHGEEIARKVSELNALFEEVRRHAEAAESQLSEGLGNLSGRMAESRGSLAETNSTLATLTESGIRLLEIIQSGAAQSREELPRAIAHAEERLHGIEQRAILLRDTIDAAGQRGGDLSSYLLETQSAIAEADGSIEQLGARLATQTQETLARVSALRASLGELEGASERISVQTREELSGAIDRLVEAARGAFAMLEGNAREIVANASTQVGAAAVDAVRRSLHDNSTGAIAEIEQAAASATGASRQAAIQLRDQLAKVNELAGNLERRVARARELAEERIDNDFARRMGLITDSLNSSSIDIARALSSEVTDTAWASYLKGDRGIFTRRAVRLIENSEAREIVELYENDEAFREHVSRYIHDFEAMLRSLLSTRDGNALGVTVLGSDMGKLYVVLAQAIERLRS